MTGNMWVISPSGGFGSSSGVYSVEDLRFFSTKQVASVTNIEPTYDFIVTYGYSSVGDSGGSIYERSLALTLGGFQSADGAFWDLSESKPNVKMFGAVGDSVVDDIIAIQAAVDYAISKSADGATVTVYLPPGRYKISTPILMFNRANVAGGAYPLSSVSLCGDHPGYVNTKRTELLPTFNDKPAIIFQNVRNSRVSGFTIVGKANTLALPSYAQLLDDDVSPWWNNSVARDSRYSPHCGVAIDPFGPLPPDGGHPGLTALYTTGSAGGSTGVIIERMEIQGFIVAVSISHSNGTSLGDSITVRDSNLSYNKISVSVGQSQNRGVDIENCHIKGARHVVTTSDYGLGTGAFPNIEGGVFLYVKWLMHSNAGYGTGTIDNLYVESMWSLGFWGWLGGGFTMHIKGCTFKFITPPAGVKNIDSNFHLGSHVVFEGCYAGFYSNVERRLNIYNAANKVVFIGTVLDGEPQFSTEEYAEFHSCANRYATGGPTSFGNRYITDLNSLAGQTISGVPGFCIENGISPTNFIRYRSVSNWDLFSVSAAAVFTVAGDGTATFTSSTPGKVKLDEYISVLSGWNGEKPDSSLPNASYGKLLVGKVTNIAGAVITISEVPKSFVTGTYTPVVYRLPKVKHRSLCTTTSGSADLTNVAPTAGWTVGCRVSGTGIPSGSYITVVAGTTLTMSQTATASASNIELFDTKYFIELALFSAAPSTGTWIKGDFVRNALGAAKDANNMVLLGWICTASGAPGTWEPSYVSAVSPAT